MFSELFAPVSIGVRTIAKTVRILERNHTGNENWIYNDNVNDPLIRKWLHQIVGKDGRIFQDMISGYA